MKAKRNSITGQVLFSTRLLTVVLMAPALISLTVMLIYAESYHASVSRMESVASLKPLVSSEIADSIWLAVAGAESFESCGAYGQIQHVNDTLETLIDKAKNDASLELIVARRTMNTLSAYAEQIDANLRLGVPVEQSQRTLNEVRAVSELIDSMLGEYITREIEAAAVTNAYLRRLAAFFAAAEGLLLLVALVIGRVMSLRLSRSIHEPIERLEHFAGLMTNGDLDARVPHTAIVELEPLTERVNIMAEHVQLLIEQNKREQENLKKAELRTMQAQINPHFLYNTLDAIIWQAEDGNAREVIRLTSALSDFFRISLSAGKDWIPVSQEIKHLNAYLSIQKTRYRDILSYEVAIDPAAQEGYILKLLLQPLVENALYHGIKDKRGGGKISVTGRLEGERLLFCVADTGKGMTKETLKDVLDRMHGDKPPEPTPYASSGSGFGLNNVDRRIRLYYNQSSGLSIESDAGGTRVSFSVPRKNGEDANS